MGRQTIYLTLKCEAEHSDYFKKSKIVVVFNFFFIQWKSLIIEVFLGFHFDVCFPVAVFY